MKYREYSRVIIARLRVETSKARSEGGVRALPAVYV